MTREKLRTAQSLLNSIDACQCIIEDIEHDESVRINGHDVRVFRKELQYFLVETKKRLELEFNIL